MAQWLSMVCRLQHRFLITTLPLVSKDKVQYTYNQCMACYANSSFIFFLPMVFILSTIIAYGV